jgi:hypothetical protein
MTNYDVVKKLVGAINPVGETNTDNERFENLKEMTHLVEMLIIDIDRVATNNQNRHEFSLKRAGDFASKFMTDDLGIV